MKKVNKIVFLSLLVVFVMFATVGTAYAQDYYVSTNGNNDNGGSQSEPFETIVHGAGELNAGDTLYIEAGTYEYERIKLRQSGTATQPINIVGVGNVIMLSDNHGHAFNLLDVEYINFDNIEIFHYSQGIFCTSCNNIHINDCHIHYIETTTVTYKDCHDCSITNTELSDTGWNTVQIMANNEDTHNIIIDNCKIHGSPGIGDFDSYHGAIDMFNCDPDQGTSHMVRDLSITNCEIYDYKADSIFTHGYEQKHMKNINIVNNEIHHCLRCTISMFENLNFENNYIHNNKWDGFRTLYPNKLIGPAYISGNVVRDSNYDTRIVATGEGIVFENEDYQLLHIEGGSVVFKNPNRETVTIKETGSGKVTFQLTDGRDFTHNGQNSKTSISGGHQLIVDGETVDIIISGDQPDPTPTISPTPTPTATPTQTSTPDPTPTEPPATQSDNRLKQSVPDTVLGSSPWLDVGRLGDTNYHSVLWFDIPNETVESATLSLFWYYDSRDNDTEVELYRPARWNPDYVTWNSYDDGLNWYFPGGVFFVKYDTVTLIGNPDNQYHEFNVTELVNRYIDGVYDNTGFFIKANDNDGYVAFYSMEHPNVNQQPKLEFTYTPDPTPTPTETPTPDPTPTETATPDPTPTEPPEHPRHDVNKDGIVDMLDLDIVASHYGEMIN